MKTYSLLLLLVLPLLAAAQQNDQICMPRARVARIADTLAYYKQYAVLADSAIAECREWADAQSKALEACAEQNAISREQAGVIGEQLLAERELRKQWQAAAEESDRKLQKAKRSRRNLSVILGVATGAGVATGVILRIVR